MKITLLSSILAGLSSAFVATSVNASQIYTLNPNAFRDSDHVKLARTVNHLNIPIIDGSQSRLPHCKPKANSVTYGFYVPSINAMVLCTANGSLADMQKTFVHETMHLVQDCRAGMDNSKMKDKNSYLTKLQYMGLDQGHKNNIHGLYHGRDKVFEVEARKLDSSPTIVWKYLIKYCA